MRSPGTMSNVEKARETAQRLFRSLNHPQARVGYVAVFWWLVATFSVPVDPVRDVIIISLMIAAVASAARPDKRWLNVLGIIVGIAIVFGAIKLPASDSPMYAPMFWLLLVIGVTITVYSVVSTGLWLTTLEMSWWTNHVEAVIGLVLVWWCGTQINETLANPAAIPFMRFVAFALLLAAGIGILSTSLVTARPWRVRSHDDLGRKQRSAHQKTVGLLAFASIVIWLDQIYTNEIVVSMLVAMQPSPVAVGALVWFTEIALTLPGVMYFTRGAVHRHGISTLVALVIGLAIAVAGVYGGMTLYLFKVLGLYGAAYAALGVGLRIAPMDTRILLGYSPAAEVDTIVYTDVEEEGTTSPPEAERMAGTWLNKAKVLYEAGEIDEAMHAVEMVFKWDADNDEARQLKEMIGAAAQ